MKFEFLFLGKTRESYLANGIDDYTNRLKYYVPLNIKILKDKRLRKNDDRGPGIIEQEGRILLAAKSKSTLLVALDKSGRQMSSEDLAGLLETWEKMGTKGVTFIIGGPLGLASSIVEKADQVISLSSMTFTHEMSRLILMEQLYRAFTIKAGGKYHK